MATQVTVITGEGSTTYSVSTGARGPAGPSSGATPAGTTGSVQINNAGALAADSGLVYTGTGNNGKLTVGGGRIYMDATTGSAPNNNVAVGGSSGGLAFSAVGFSGFLNVSVGAGNLSAITTGDRNVVCGSYSLYSLTTGSSNLAIGNNTLTELTTGVRNTAMGNGAGGGITTGNDNVFINRGAVDGTLSCQIAIGGTSDGASSTVIGFDGASNESPTTTTRFIGNTLTWGSGVSSVNNRTSLVQSATTSAKTITLPNATGKLPVYTDTPATGKVLTATDASGAATWQTPSGGTPTNAQVNTAISTDYNATLRSLNLEMPQTFGHRINSQPYVAKRLSAFDGASVSAPIRIMTWGDSFITGEPKIPNGAPSGTFGLMPFGGSVTTSGTATTKWINKTTATAPVSATPYEFYLNGVTTHRYGNKFAIAFITNTTAGTYSLEYESSLSVGTWTAVTAGTSISTQNATQIGVYNEYTLPTSNTPAFKIRITVSGTALEIVTAGIYNSLGGGVIYMPFEAPSGFSPYEINIPNAIFNPIWSGLAPDVVQCSFLETGRTEWDANAATALVAGINYVIATIGNTDFTLVGAASNTVGLRFTATGAGIGTGTANGGFRVIYDQSKASGFASTDWIMVGPHYIDPTTAGNASEATVDLQCQAMTDFALEKDQTFFDARYLFRSYAKANAKGLMQDDKHLNTAGKALRSRHLWATVPIGQFPLGISGTSLDLPLVLAGPEQNIPSSKSLLVPRSLHIKDGSDQGMVFWNQSSPLAFTSAARINTRNSSYANASSELQFGSSNNTGLLRVSNLSYVSITGGFGVNAFKNATTTANAYVYRGDTTILCNATSGAITANLGHSSIDTPGRIHIFKKTDSSANTVTIDPLGSETIDGAATYVLSLQYSTVTIMSDGTNWHVISKF